ncbi:MAG: adenylate/guanylate cyclase domain-containing protein [Deltaproteobacteria bacterium]|nr:adenylate/guanylate cyclase domain-containing protein [Deltaproteobacteria bacterium]
MLPNLIPHYSVGPFIGLIANGVMSILCLVTLGLYRQYHPLRSLFLFYLLSALLFLGWVIYGFQKSPLSILWGYRIDLAALALLPATWAWFTSSLDNMKQSRLSQAIIGISLILALMALAGQGSWFLGLPLVPHEVATGILRPQSKLLRPLIHFFTLAIGFFYCLTAARKLLKREGPSYLLPFVFGMILWLLGGLHDILRSSGLPMPFGNQIFWFTSFWLSISLTLTVAVHFRALEKTVRETRDVFEKFVPPAYLRRIAIHGLGSIRPGQADQQWVTVLCCDIRGFTALSERLSPAQLITLVNQLYEEFAHVVNAKQGVIDKFLGDAVLCIFEGSDSAQRAVACGVDMLTSVRTFNAANQFSPDHVIQIGVGVHSGPVILGTIGSTERMDSTVLGLTVNLAKRIEELTKSLGVVMLISAEVVSHLPKVHPHRLRSLGEVSVKGSSVPLTVYEVRSNKSSD